MDCNTDEKKLARSSGATDQAVFAHYFNAKKAAVFTDIARLAKYLGTFTKAHTAASHRTKQLRAVASPEFEKEIQSIDEIRKRVRAIQEDAVSVGFDKTNAAYRAVSEARQNSATTLLPLLTAWRECNGNGWPTGSSDKMMRTCVEHCTTACAALQALREATGAFRVALTPHLKSRPFLTATAHDGTGAELAARAHAEFPADAAAKPKRVVNRVKKTRSDEASETSCVDSGGDSEPEGGVDLDSEELDINDDASINSELGIVPDDAPIEREPRSILDDGDITFERAERKRKKKLSSTPVADEPIVPIAKRIRTRAPEVIARIVDDERKQIEDKRRRLDAVVEKYREKAGGASGDKPSADPDGVSEIDDSDASAGSGGDSDDGSEIDSDFDLSGSDDDDFSPNQDAESESISYGTDDSDSQSESSAPRRKSTAAKVAKLAAKLAAKMLARKTAKARTPDLDSAKSTTKLSPKAPRPEKTNGVDKQVEAKPKAPTDDARGTVGSKFVVQKAAPTPVKAAKPAPAPTKPAPTAAIVKAPAPAKPAAPPAPVVVPKAAPAIKVAEPSIEFVDSDLF